MLRSKIEELQQLQKTRLNDQQLSQLPQNTQIAFCRTHKEIGELAYQAYEQMKHDLPLEAAHYFALSIYYSVQKAFDIRDQESRSISTTNFEDVASLETKEDTFKLGICYLIGIGKYIQNNQIAFKLFSLAAKQSEARAQYSLGFMYAFGKGVPKDKAEAAKWFRLAAEQGHASAQFNLGVMYDIGEGVPKDKAEAAKWFRLAAEQGYVAAQFNLGVIYNKGDGVPKDQAEAVKWYRLAAGQGHAGAQFNLGIMYGKGEGVPKDQAEAVKWYRLAAEQGHVSAQWNLGFMYNKGEGVPKDQAEAVKWYRLAAEQGHANAIKKLSEKKDFSAIYHTAMMKRDENSVIKLLSEKKSVSEELLFDIQRSVKNDVLFEAVLSIIHQLKEKGTNTDRYQLEINNVTIQKILIDHQEKNNRLELYDDQTLVSLYSTLAKISFSDVASEQIHPLLNLLIDSWYIATSTQIESTSQIINQTVTYLTQLIHKLNNQTKPILDSYIALQCSLILIQDYLDKQYEVAFKSLELNDLNLLLALIKSKKPVEQINKTFGKNIIIEVNFNSDLIKSVITRLDDYLKSHKDKVSTFPYLASLNHCLIDSADNLNDERELRNMLRKILITTSEYQSFKKQMRSNTFFKTLELDDEVKGIYRLLKCQDVKGLKECLEKIAQKDLKSERVYGKSV